MRNTKSEILGNFIVITSEYDNAETEKQDVIDRINCSLDFITPTDEDYPFQSMEEAKQKIRETINKDDNGDAGWYDSDVHDEDILDIHCEINEIPCCLFFEDRVMLILDMEYFTACHHFGFNLNFFN